MEGTRACRNVQILDIGLRAVHDRRAIRSAHDDQISGRCSRAADDGPVLTLPSPAARRRSPGCSAIRRPDTCPSSAARPHGSRPRRAAAATPRRSPLAASPYHPRRSAARRSRLHVGKLHPAAHITDIREIDDPISFIIGNIRHSSVFSGICDMTLTVRYSFLRHHGVKQAVVVSSPSAVWNVIRTSCVPGTFIPPGRVID